MYIIYYKNYIESSNPTGINGGKLFNSNNVIINYYYLDVYEIYIHF